jgi:demethylmenaquinone methyltransferase/2-methoxy-6-polyprenyl-1,4-benzoquinol methylase
MFSAIAPRYDFLNRVLSVGRDRVWRREAIRAIGLPAAGRLLDVCTGTADMALEAGRQCPTATIAGVDFSAAMIGLGRRKAAGAHLADRIHLSVAPAEALPFGDQVFDGATVAFGLRNVPDRRQALAEMLRVLKPGGRAVVLEFTTPPGRLFRRIYLWYFHRVLPVIGGFVSGHRSAYAYLPASVSDFPPPIELAARMVEAGFHDVSYRLLTGGIVAIHVGIKGSSQRSAIGHRLPERPSPVSPVVDR